MRTFFYCDSHESQQRGKTTRVKMLVKNFKKTFSINFLKFKGTIIQSTEIVIMLQFLGPEIESSFSPIFWPRNCINPAFYFQAKKLSKCCNLWARILQLCTIDPLCIHDCILKSLSVKLYFKIWCTIEQATRSYTNRNLVLTVMPISPRTYL